MWDLTLRHRNSALRAAGAVVAALLLPRVRQRVANNCGDLLPGLALGIRHFRRRIGIVDHKGINAPGIEPMRQIPILVARCKFSQSLGTGQQNGPGARCSIRCRREPVIMVSRRRRSGEQEQAQDHQAACAGHVRLSTSIQRHIAPVVPCCQLCQCARYG